MQWVDRIGSRLKLRDLHILLVVVQQRSMAKAAAQLAISQPAVSKAIADMEHTFGLRLLDRGRSGVQPTAYGRALVARGQAIFDELKLGIEELAFLADPTVGELHIASTESVAAGLLPAVLERFSREQPGIRINIAQAVMNTVHYRDLRERNIDILIGRIPDPFDESDLEAKIIYHDQVVVVVGRQSKWARSRKLALSDLVREQWVLPPDDTMPGLLAGELFRAGGAVPPRAPITTLSMHLCCHLAASSKFVTMLPGSILRFNALDHALKILPIRLASQRRPVGIVTLRNRTLTPASRLFIECVHRTAA
ncbi:MAG TPA: LysR family transcriptional regulator [Xanthobacteraceae bacterium]|jgi:DNA-binding transcriptional LysR family regulator|nr:LysR family transcriptional regulator [Xanthobacteraceae bacterium]